jgi:hypothetical protein
MLEEEEMLLLRLLTAQQYSAEETQANSSFHSTLDLHSRRLRHEKCFVVHFIILVTSLLFLNYSLVGKMTLSSPCVDFTMHRLQTFTQSSRFNSKNTFPTLVKMVESGRSEHSAKRDAEDLVCSHPFTV